MHGPPLAYHIWAIKGPYFFMVFELKCSSIVWAKTDFAMWDPMNNWTNFKETSGGKKNPWIYNKLMFEANPIQDGHHSSLILEITKSD